MLRTFVLFVSATASAFSGYWWCLSAKLQVGIPADITSATSKGLLNMSSQMNYWAAVWAAVGGFTLMAASILEVRASLAKGRDTLRDHVISDLMARGAITREQAMKMTMK